MSKATLGLPLLLASAETTLPSWAIKYQGYSWASSAPNSTCSQSWDPMQLWRAASIPWAAATLPTKEKTTIMPGRSPNPKELLFQPPTPSSHPIRHWLPLSLGKVLAPTSLCLYLLRLQAYLLSRQWPPAAAAAAKSLQSCPTLCNPQTSARQAPPSLGFSRQEHWGGWPFPSPMPESEKWKWSRSVVSHS